MAAAAGILNRQLTAGQSLTTQIANPMVSSASGTSGTSSSNDSSDDSATISANDFLTLLVTEMQNQDPTADVDPNEYIDQLVQVNSLEQLIDINQTLSTNLGSSTSSSTGATSQAAGATSAVTGAAAPAASALSSVGSTPSAGSALQSFAARLAPGNLSVPTANPAAERVAHALDGHTRAQANLGRVAATQ